MELQLTRLTAVVEQGFETVRREVVELKEYQREMNGKVGRAYERMSASEAVVDGHARELGGLRKRVHELANQVVGRDVKDLDGQSPTWKTLGQVAAVIGGAIAATYWFLTVIVGLHR